MSCGNFTSETLDWSGCDRCECLSSIQLTFGEWNETKPFLRRSLISTQSYRAISLDSNGLRNDSQRSHALTTIRHCLIIISIICSCLTLPPLSRIAIRPVIKPNCCCFDCTLKIGSTSDTNAGPITKHTLSLRSKLIGMFISERDVIPDDANNSGRFV